MWLIVICCAQTDARVIYKNSTKNVLTSNIIAAPHMPCKKHLRLDAHNRCRKVVG